MPIRLKSTDFALLQEEGRLFCRHVNGLFVRMGVMATNDKFHFKHVVGGISQEECSSNDLTIPKCELPPVGPFSALRG